MHLIILIKNETHFGEIYTHNKTIEEQKISGACIAKYKRIQKIQINIWNKTCLELNNVTYGMFVK